MYLLCNMIKMDFNVSLYQVPLDVQMNDKYVINGANANETRLKIMHLSEEDQGSYRCHAIFHLGESESHIELVVLSYLVPLKPFLAIAAEVVFLVAIILLCEMYTQRKKNRGRIYFFQITFSCYDLIHYKGFNIFLGKKSSFCYLE